MTKNEDSELIKRTVNLIVYDIYVFFDLINSIYLINSGPTKVLKDKLIERSLNFMKTASNRSIVNLFIEKSVLTRLEISVSLGLEEVSISQKLKTLRSVGFIEKKGRVGTPYRTRKMKGAGIPLWGIIKAKPQDYVDAQKRYGEILLSTKDSLPIGQSQLLEALALSKIYMEDRGLKTIPDRVILIPLMEYEGIKVTYDSLVNALVEEGYSW